MRTPGISGIGNLRLPGLAPAPGRRPPQPGCFGLGTIAATKILFQLIKFQVYGQADNSSITIACCGAVSDCGNLIKTSRLAVPSPAGIFRRWAIDDSKGRQCTMPDCDSPARFFLTLGGTRHRQFPLLP